MLVLTRSVGETIRIGDDIEISVAEVKGGTVRLSIKAPREVKVFREEVYQRIAQSNTVAEQVKANAAGALAAAHADRMKALLADTPQPAPSDDSDTNADARPAETVAAS